MKSSFLKKKFVLYLPKTLLIPVDRGCSRYEVRRFDGPF